MTPAALLQLRLHNQHLLAPRRTPLDVVRSLGALQSQDFPSACWAIGQRTTGLVQADVLRAFDEGRIVRTHVLRPTWHFVDPADLRWMLRLTGPRVQAIAAAYYRNKGLDARMLARSRTVLAKELQKRRYRTRNELAAAFAKSRLPVEPLAVSFLMMDAELTSLVCSGPKRGAQFTYALVDERIPATKALDGEAALAELTRRYFSSHGPATARDFAWWSGLTQRDARAGLAQNGQFESATIEGLTYWFAPPAAQPPRRSRPVAHLLPNYDEYLGSYRDRALVGDHAVRGDPGAARAMPHGLVIDGQLAGGWRRTPSTTGADVAVQPARRLRSVEIEAVESAAAEYGRFTGMPVRLSVSPPG